MAGGETVDLSHLMKEHQERMRQEYEGKLADLEKERESIEEEKAQVSEEEERGGRRRRRRRRRREEEEAQVRRRRRRRREEGGEVGVGERL